MERTERGAIGKFAAYRYHVCLWCAVYPHSDTTAYNDITASALPSKHILYALRTPATLSHIVRNRLEDRLLLRPDPREHHKVFFESVAAPRDTSWLFIPEHAENSSLRHDLLDRQDRPLPGAMRL
jgi:hypothetical protein